MTSTEFLGLVGTVAFVAFIYACLRTTTRWGAATAKREAEYLKSKEIQTPDEAGKIITIIRDPSQEPTDYDPNQPRPCSSGQDDAAAARPPAV